MRDIIKGRISKSQNNQKRLCGKWLSLPENDPKFDKKLKWQKSHAVVSDGVVFVGKLSEENGVKTWQTLTGAHIKKDSVTHIYQCEHDKPIECLVSLQCDFNLFFKNGDSE